MELRPLKFLSIAMFGILIVVVGVVSTSVVLVKRPNSATISMQTFDFENIGGSKNRGDTWVSSTAPMGNFGTFSSAVIGKNALVWGTCWAYISFDLSSIPDGATITNATIHLYNALGSMGTLVWTSRTADTWNENTLTWNNKPSPFGGMLDAKIVTTIGWHSWSVTTGVQNGKSENNIISLVFFEPTSIEATINENTKEAGTARAPYLEVTYTPYVPPVPPENLSTISDNVSGNPSFDITPSGKWIVTWKSPVDGDIQGGRGMIYYKTSTDQGASWSSASLLFSQDGWNTWDSNGYNYDGAEVVIMPDDSLWVMSSKLIQGTADGSPYYSLAYRKSTDDGVTWGAENYIDNIFAHQPDLIENGWLYAIGNHCLRVGSKILIPVYVRDNSVTVVAEAGCLMTSDSGSTWTFSFINGVGFGGIQGSEPAIAWIGGNNLISIWRSVNSETNHAYKSTSSDLGDSWSAPVDIGRANGGIFNWIWDPELFWFNDNTLALIAAQTDQDVWPSCPASLTLWTSTDSGTTWTWIENIMENTAWAELYHGVESTGENTAYMVYNDGGTATASYIIGANLTYTTYIPPPPPSVYTSHAPITITGNSGFAIGENGVTSGSGTVGDPWIIEGWSIDATDTAGISISGTTSYFIVRSCLIENGGSTNNGIALLAVQNGNISGNTLNNNAMGISVSFSSHNVISANETDGGTYGIVFIYSDTNDIFFNIATGNSSDGIHVTLSSYNYFLSNICTSNVGNGINLQSSPYNELVGNACTGNSIHGIYVGFTSVGCSFFGNTGDIFYEAANVFSFSISPPHAEMVAGLPATFVITFAHVGENAMTCFIQITDTQGWITTAVPSTVTVPENGSAVSLLAVWIPSNLDNNTLDTITVIVRSSDLTILGTGTCSVLGRPLAEFITPPPSGVFSGLISLLSGFTGGDTTTAGYLVALFFIMAPMMVVGVGITQAGRSSKYSGLIVMSFFLMGMFVCVLTGLFPWWPLTFIVALIALVMARDWI